MGYSDALRDGIRMSNSKTMHGYYPSCQFCGREIYVMNYRSGVRYTCDQCKPLKRLLLATGLFDPPKDESKCD